MDLAREMSKLLESDSVAAAQIKEHISAERLIELFGLTRDDLPKGADDPRSFSEMLNESDFTNEDALQHVVGRFKKSEILAALGDD